MSNNDSSQYDDPDVTETHKGEMREISKPLGKERVEREEADVIEQVIYVDRRRRVSRLAQIKRSIRMFGCLPLLFLCGIFLYVLITRTDPYWGSIVSFLNQGEELTSTESELTYEQAQGEFEDQIQDLGENQVKLTNQQMTVLAREHLSELPEVTIEADADVIHLYWNVEDSSDQGPLLGRIDMRLDEENEPFISYVGLNRFGIPSSLSKQLSEALLPVLQFTYGSSTPSQLLSVVFTGNENNEIYDIEFKDDEVQFTIQISLSIFEE